jgi:hypothetical protein
MGHLGTAWEGHYGIALLLLVPRIRRCCRAVIRIEGWSQARRYAQSNDLHQSAGGRRSGNVPPKMPQSPDCAQYRTVSTSGVCMEVLLQDPALPRPDEAGTMLPLIQEGASQASTFDAPRHNVASTVQGARDCRAAPRASAPPGDIGHNREIYNRAVFVEQTPCVHKQRICIYEYQEGFRKDSPFPNLLLIAEQLAEGKSPQPIIPSYG